MPLGCRFVSTHPKIGSVENDYTSLPYREWNQKQKHKKTALGQSGMLRIWRRDCALCVIGNEFPCRQPHNPTPTLLRGLSTLPQGQKPLAVSRRKTLDAKHWHRLKAVFYVFVFDSTQLFSIELGKSVKNGGFRCNKVG